MVTIKAAIRDIRRLVSDLQKAGYDPKKAILFGSVAKQRANELSDIDVAIWDDRFTGVLHQDIENMVTVLRGYPRYEIHTYPGNETASDNPFISEIEKHGIVAFPQTEKPGL